jgi:hypothetical protein
MVTIAGHAERLDEVVNNPDKPKNGRAIREQNNLEVFPGTQEWQWPGR